MTPDMRLEVELPSVQIFGVVVIENCGSAEASTRAAAAEARKWLTRLTFASARTPASAASAGIPAVTRAKDLLDGFQGDRSIQPSPTLAAQFQSLALQRFPF